MKITKEQALAIGGDESQGLIILNLVPGIGIECGTANIGGIHSATLKEFAKAAAQAVQERMQSLDGCQCPKCCAERALSHNAPRAIEALQDPEILAAVIEAGQAELLKRHPLTLFAILGILQELDKATEKHPTMGSDIVHAAAVVGEESGELIRATLMHHYEDAPLGDAIKEAAHTAATALRFIITYNR